MARVELRGVGKRFGRTDVVRDVDLDIADGEFCVIVGPSGSGKSTLLRLIAGLEDPSFGEIRFNGERVDFLAPARRGIAMVFQSYALYPHMTVRDNLAFGLRQSGMDRGAVAERIAAAAKLLQIEPLLDRRPRQLSGGQQQRVAIGRAIVREARVFLFDEPLSNLDAALRVQMRIELQTLHRRLGTTMIYVTHDQIEAMTLADRMVVLDTGSIAQVGAPLEVYRRPANLFVAGFVGSPRMNIIPATVAEVEERCVRVRLPGGGVTSVPVRGDGMRPETALSFGVRAEDLALADDAEAGFRAEVRAVERIGSGAYVYATLPDGTMVVAAAPVDTQVDIGASVVWRPNAARCYLFDAAGEALPPAAA